MVFFSSWDEENFWLENLAYAFFRFVRHLERFRISVTDTFHIQAPYVTSMEKKIT